MIEYFPILFNQMPVPEGVHLKGKPYMTISHTHIWDHIPPIYMIIYGIIYGIIYVQNHMSAIIYVHDHMSAIIYMIIIYVRSYTCLSYVCNHIRDHIREII